ncbi:MAG TPA: Sir2 family NAD-dependent protein deacetylase [Acidimicrobiales bacterium]
MDAALADAVAEVQGWLAEARRIVALTGAGISTDSGIADFRGPNGLWTKDPSAEKASHIDHYLGDPDVRRRAWRLRLEHPLAAEPNAGHNALVTLERTGRLHQIVTQNIDGLHLAAGSDPARVVEVHGTVREAACLDCGVRMPMSEALARVEAGEDDPPCRVCGGILKSATISFGQALVPRDLMRADEAARACDLLLAIGSTLSVYPVADMVPTAVAAGARVVIINGSPTAMDDIADVVLNGSISEILTELTANLES